MNAETRVSLAVASGFQAAHYLNAQKIRTRMEHHFRCGAGQEREAVEGRRLRRPMVQPRGIRTAAST